MWACSDRRYIQGFDGSNAKDRVVRAKDASKQRLFVHCNGFLTAHASSSLRRESKLSPVVWYANCTNYKNHGFT